MYVKHLDHPPHELSEEFEVLKVEKSYPLPYAFKFLAWFLVVAGIVISSTLLILYGITFGMVKSYLWLTGFFSSFLMSLLVILPVRIFVLSIINAVCFKRKPLILNRRIDPFALLNPPNEEKKKEVLKYRHFNAKLYRPLPSNKLEKRAEDIKYNLELRYLTLTIFLFFLFMVAASCTIVFTKTYMIYYTNDLIVEFLVKGNYTGTIPFNEVNTFETFMTYLERTFMPVVFPFNLSAGGSIFLRGSTMEPSIKLLGVPRLRQVRVTKDSCMQLEYLRLLDSDCAAELTFYNIETGNYSLRWEPYSPSRLTPLQGKPWIYQSPLESGTLPIYAKYGVYPGGGYIIEMARHMVDVHTIQQYLNTFGWLDFKTRAIFIELLLYSSNTNLFSVITLIAERPSIGIIIPSYQIDTYKFMPMSSDMELFDAGAFLLFMISLILLIIRESLIIRRVTFKFYVTNAFSLDVVIILFGLLTLVFFLLRTTYVQSITTEFRQSENNKFVSFYYAAFLSKTAHCIEALLMCMCGIKIFHLLNFRISFFQVQHTLNICFKIFITLYFQAATLIFAFSVFFNIKLGSFIESFSSIGNSVSTLTGRAAGVVGSNDVGIFLTNNSFLIPILFFLFILLITICICNIFIAVICVHFHKIRRTAFCEKYSISDYIKFVLTFSRQKDIMHMKDLKVLEEKKKAEEPDVMRLKGGGNTLKVLGNKLKGIEWNKLKRSERSMKRNSSKRKKVEEGLNRVAFNDFVTSTWCDLTDYMDLKPDRDLGMKLMTIMLLSNDKNCSKDTERCRALRETCLMSIFNCLIKQEEPLYETAGKFFFAELHSKKVILNQHIYSKMKKVVEDMGREKSIIEQDESGDEYDVLENKISELDYKLCMLIKKLKNIK